MRKCLISFAIFLLGAAWHTHAQGQEERTVPPERYIPGEALVVEVPADSGAFISGGYPIDAEGFVEFPVLGRLKVSDKSRSNLEEYLGQQMAPYLTDTHLRVRPALRLTFLGNFKIQGLFYVHPDKVVWDAFNYTQGPMSEFNWTDMYVRRGREVVALEPLEAFASGKTLREAGVRSGDVFVIPTPTERDFWFYTKEIVELTTGLTAAVASVVQIYLLYENLKDR